jgi:hypothetical protein
MRVARWFAGASTYFTIGDLGELGQVTPQPELERAISVNWDR